MDPSSLATQHAFIHSSLHDCTLLLSRGSHLSITGRVHATSDSRGRQHGSGQARQNNTFTPYSQHFTIKIFKHREKMKKLTMNTNTRHLPSTIVDMLLYLPYHISSSSIIHGSIVFFEKFSHHLQISLLLI